MNTPEESWLVSGGRWSGPCSAVLSVDGTAAYGADNSLVLFAMTKARYAQSSDAYGRQIRDFIIDTKRPNGRFDQGRACTPTSWARLLTESLYPSRALWGVVEYTRAFPTRANWAGTMGGPAMRDWCRTAVEQEHSFVMSGAANYDDTGIAAVHMASAAATFDMTGAQKYKDMARETWNLLSSRQSANGRFSGAGTLRAAEIQFMIEQTVRYTGDLGGMKKASNALDDNFVMSGGFVTLKGGGDVPCGVEQCYVWRLLVGDKRVQVLAGHRARRAALADGAIYFTGVEGNPGATETQGLGWLGDTIDAP